MSTTAKDSPGPPRGSRVRLLATTDPYTRRLPGALGTVLFTDDLGTIMVQWDDGGYLGLIPDVDRFETLSRD